MRGDPPESKYARNILKTVLESKSTNPEHFFSNRNVDYAIVRVSNVKDITVEEDEYGTLKSRIKVSINGLPLSRNVDPLLNKDFRWIKYWSRIYKMDTIAEKKSQYIKLLNKKSKTLYLLLYRHTFPNGQRRYWIVGMHWL